MIKRAQLVDWQDFSYELRRLTDSFPEFEGVSNGSYLEYDWDNNPNSHNRWRIQNYMIDKLDVEIEKIFSGEETLLIWKNW